ncbi:DUF247 domain-containing protein [Cephalotus follicularis]|uniref:DUF247 domain-containing protein n=1 Tax=Cephalotus follicularis TaxID=3775 RepID=A0A1Q3C1L0_CEPFO|nr:DUF247 domain-containing protein [Cephalotus follicularis]
MQRPDEQIARHRNLTGRHLLDLVRSSYVPFHQSEPIKFDTPTHIIHCVSKLRRAGIGLESLSADSFLELNFIHGFIQMPPITFDDFMISLLLNCVAYEQCHGSCSTHFTTYATLLDCLVNTSKDVGYLSDHNIIENHLGTDAEVAKFINNMGKEVAFDINRCYLSKLFNDVHKYYENSWHVQWASFKYTYFNTPWSCISAFAALLLLLLTVAQTVFSVYGVLRTKSD